MFQLVQFIFLVCWSCKGLRRENPIFIVRLHVMQRAVLLSQFCPSVCLSARFVYCDKTKWQSVNISTQGISLVFPFQRELLEIVPFHPKYSPKMTHPFEKRRLRQISAYNVSTVRKSDKRSITTNRKSTTSFPANYRWSAYVAPKSLKSGSKTIFR